MPTRRQRATVNLTDQEAAALQAHPDYTGSIGGTLRLLALRAAGLEPSDPYDAVRDAVKSRPRDKKGRIMRKYFADVTSAETQGVNLPDGLTHIFVGYGHGDHYYFGFPSLEEANKYRKVWLNPASHEVCGPAPGYSHHFEMPNYERFGGRELDVDGEGGFKLTWPEGDSTKRVAR